MQIGFYQSNYNDCGLNSVSKALLGETKLGSGANIEQLSKEKLLRYNEQDAKLTMKLVQHNNFEVLAFIKAISDITKIELDQICRTGVSTWWAKIIKNACPSLKYSERIQKKAYTGGHVIEPKKGYYKESVYCFDVASLYPTMMINYNLSNETVNCKCCEYNPHLSKEELGIDNDYWVCAKLGIIPKLLFEYRNKRLGTSVPVMRPYRVPIKY